MNELPEGWAEATIGAIASVQLGKMLDKAKRTRGTRLPYLRNANVRWGTFALNDLLEMPFEDDELERYGVRRGDLFICEGGEPGRSAVWDRPDSPELKFQKALIRVRPHPKGVDPRWIMFALQLAAHAGELESYFTGSTIKHLPREAALRFLLRIPPFTEQRRIVEKVEALLSRVHAVRARIARLASVVGLESHQRAISSGLERAILGKAFAGELVPTEAELARREGRSYEPASDLLDRVRRTMDRPPIARRRR